VEPGKTGGRVADTAKGLLVILRIVYRSKIENQEKKHDDRQCHYIGYKC
jgi:hypothetical protein